MPASNKINITTDLLGGLESSSGLIDLVSEQGFLDVLKLNRALIYILVNWSGPERLSRYYVYRALNDFGKHRMPLFKIDCSDQRKEYVEDWLIRQGDNKKDFCYGGWGETLLISKGDIIEFIGNPGKIGQVKTEEKIHEWINYYSEIFPNTR